MGKPKYTLMRNGRKGYEMLHKNSPSKLNPPPPTPTAPITPKPRRNTDFSNPNLLRYITGTLTRSLSGKSTTSTAGEPTPSTKTNMDSPVSPLVTKESPATKTTPVANSPDTETA